MLKIINNLIILLILFFSTESISSEEIFFLSLKNSEVNLRSGPSFQHPIRLTYKKRHLPLLILDKSETWRQAKDFNNNSGWIHISQLSKKNLL